MEDEKMLLEEEKESKRVYKLSLWWVEHRVLLRQIGYGIFIAFDTILILFVLWTFVDSFLLRYDAETNESVKLAVLGQSDLNAYTVANKAKDLSFETVRVFALGDSRYDFYTEVLNPNNDWWVEFDYQFLYASESTPVMKGFLLPGQSKPIIALAASSPQSVTGAQIDLIQITWHRLDHHQIFDYATWQQDRLNMEITEPKFTQETGFTDDTFGRTTFTVHNNTAFGYFDPQFYVLLKQGTSVVGVNRATVASLGAGEKIDVTLNWFGVLPGVSSVEIVPDIDLFNLNVYQRPAGDPTIDTRTQVRPK